MDKIIESKRPQADLEDICSSTDTRVLRRVFFLNGEKTLYVSVEFYPADNYQVLPEFGGPCIAPITLTEQHVKTLMEHPPSLCKAMHR